VEATPASDGGQPTAAELLALGSSSELDPYVAGRAMVLEGRLQEGSDLFRGILAGTPHGYTIQVGVLVKPETVRRYFQRAADGTSLMLFQGKERNFLTIGVFESQKEAWAAVQELPEFFRKQNAVVKPVSQILSELPEVKAKPIPKPKPAAEG
jgi:hypothetical protein